MDGLYWVLVILATVWVGWDCIKRRASFLWPIGTLLLLPVTLPWYYAARPLLDGERREGGRGWNVVRNLALSWTVLMALIGFSAMSAVSGTVAQDTTGGAALGAGLGMGMIGALWFFPMVGLLVLGLFLKNSEIELGQSAEPEPEPGPERKHQPRPAASPATTRKRNIHRAN